MSAKRTAATDAPVYVDVVLPLALPNLFTYLVPPELVPEIEPGKRVIVPFGKKKMYSGVIRRLGSAPSGLSDGIKEIHTVLDARPVVNELQFALWEWIAAYYMCTIGDVMNSAMPAALKLQSETRIILDPSFDLSVAQLSAQEEVLVEALQKKNELTIEDVSALLNKASVHSLIKKSFEKGIIILSEEMRKGFRPKNETRLRLAASYVSEDSMKRLFMELEQDARKAKQLDALMVFLKLLLDDPSRSSVRKAQMTSYEGMSKSSVESLVRNGILVEYQVQVDRIPSAGDSSVPPSALSEVQEDALRNIKALFDTHDTVLFHGVTSSGKTEVYIHLISEMIAAGKQVLYLLPEIALTTQIIQRLQKHFGNSVGVYHSRYSSNERVEVWNHVLGFSSGSRTKSQVILGARSSLFLPFSNLGLIIVDEEHDASYKQSEPAPRYNARDAAIVLAKAHGAKTLLGSATPSLESYYNAAHDKYGLVKLTIRHGGVKMPEIIIADTRESKRKKLMKSHFSPELMEALGHALQNNEQVILFQNRRGFSNFVECRHCAWIPKCRNCSVTLTYHKHGNTLKCHYCGYGENLPASCPVCGDFHIEVKGYGTEKIEEEISIFFPDARIARMDLDAARTRSAFQKLITDFEEGRIDILVGTQMVTKGLDFDNVTTVGIINADQLLNFPDFRSFERSFQLMAQVSGRSGRKQKRGKVIIQTQQPEHWVIRDVVNNDYENFYARDLQERKKFHYPPHARLIGLTIRHKEEEQVKEASQVIAEMLRKDLANRVLGPHIPLVSKIRNLYYRNILIRLERDIAPSKVKELIRKNMDAFYADRKNHQVHIIPDVDPQ